MAGDNGEVKKEGENIETPKVVVMTIYMNKATQRIEIEGLINQKQLCLNALAEAIKAVANFTAPIIQTARPGLMTGLARRFGKH